MDNSQNSFNETLPIINGETINVEDMAATKDINEVDLLYNLKNRLNQDKTFTNVGPTLIIVNPFKQIKDVYGAEKIEYFMKKHEKENPELRDKITEPHLYDVVLLAIREILKSNCKNQALIVSGESGAGKTVATKNSMQCITYYFSKLKEKMNARESVIYSSKNEMPISQNTETPLEKKILDCNPILEGFGNAKTVRNDNSSRFGKYVKIKINKETNLIEGAQMFTYLLEKSRITELGCLERNYHIFYFFLKGAEDSLLKELNLTKDIKSYEYLWHDKSKNQVTEVPSIDDVACFQEVIDCFKSTNFSDEEIQVIFKVIAAVLLIGNIKFKVDNSKCNLENRDVYDNICKLLNIDADPLLDALTRKFMPSEKKYGGSYDQNQIKSYFDGLAKELYNRLFLWIVKKLNKTLDITSSEDDTKYIGLLDIFGFECFQKENNSIEQLCINYTNEQLQQLYIKDIFESDKAEFRREGLEDKLYLLDATYKDNKDVIKLIKIFFLKISDVTMEDKKIYDLVKNFDKFIKTDKLFKKVKENKFGVDKFVNPFFSVEHSAKVVEYSCTNMIDKNKDEMKIKVSECILNSTNDIFKLIFTMTLTQEEFEVEKSKILDESRVVSKNEKFLGLKFCKEMKQLKKELKLCDHHYVRCLKPNEEKKAHLFYSNFVFNQIQYLGILATVQVRKNGFPMRRTYEDFYENYKIILSKTVDKSNCDYMELCKEIIVYLIGDEEANSLKEQYLFGKTKIYMKQSFNQKLELKKVEILKKKIDAVSVIKVAIVNIKKRTKVNRISNSTIKIQNYLKVNRFKIKVKTKKDKIKRIQSLYHTYNLKKEMYFKNKNYLIIQNSLKILVAKKKLQQKKNLMKFLSINLQIYRDKMKQIHIKKVKKAVSYIVEETKKKFVYRQYSLIWGRVSPFFLKLLTNKRNKRLKQEAEKLVMKNKYISCFNIFQLSLFNAKIKEKKKSIHCIYSYASTKIFSNYYKDMINNIKIIQKYMQIYIIKMKVFDKINKNFFKEENELDNEEEEEEENEDLGNNLNNPSKENKKNGKNGKNNKKDGKKTIQSENDKNRAKSTLNDTRFTTIGMINDPKTNRFPTNNLATLNTIENDKLSTIRQPGKKKYIDNFSTIESRNLDQKSKNKSTKNNKLNNRNKNRNVDKFLNKGMGKTTKFDENKDNPEDLLPFHYSFNQPIIGVFAKILDVDHICNCSEVSDKSWDEEFAQIYKENLKNDTPIQKIEISNCSSMALNSAGKVYSWGWNNFGQCGVFPSETKLSYVFPKFAKQKNNKFPFLPVLNYKDYDKNLPIQNVSNMSLDEDFSIIVTQKGNAILFGDNSYGQLGQGHRMEVKSAQILTKFKNKIKNLYTTGNMNILLTKKNEAYMWFFADRDEFIQPFMINLPKKIKIESISTGKNFAILLSFNGICFGLGSNEMGELGMKDVKFCERPQEIINLIQFNERIIQVKCGYKHTVCVSINGKVYSWGNNSFGQLGHINNGDNLPNYINIEDKGERVKIIQVCAGFRTSYFLTSKGAIYYTGVLNKKEKTNIPKKYNLYDKNEIVSNDKEFLPIKIWTTYCNSKTIFYASFADIRNLTSKFFNIERIKEIAFSLAEKWTDDEITAPFIPHLSKYFQSNFMKIEEKKK